MFDSIVSYFAGQSNYSVVNKPNLYNFIISFSEILDETQKQKCIELMKLHLGIKFSEELRMYLYRKCPTSALLKFLQ